MFCDEEDDKDDEEDKGPFLLQGVGRPFVPQASRRGTWKPS